MIKTKSESMKSKNGFKVILKKDNGKILGVLYADTKEEAEEILKYTDKL